MEKKPYPSELQDRFIVRFPEGMRDQIAEAAKANNRSMNSEIVARLEASFVAPSIDRDVALAQGAAGAVLKGLERVNENVALFAKRMERIEARLEAGGGVGLEVGTPSAVQGPAPEPLRTYVAPSSTAEGAQPKRLKIPVSRQTTIEVQPLSKPAAEDVEMEKEVVPDLHTRQVRRRKDGEQTSLLSPDLGKRSVDSSLAHYAEVINRRQTADPVPPKPPVNKGPPRSPNTKRKPA